MRTFPRAAGLWVARLAECGVRPSPRATALHGGTRWIWVHTQRPFPAWSTNTAAPGKASCPAVEERGSPLVVHPRSNPLLETRGGAWQTPRPSAETIAAVQKSCMAVADKPVRLAEAFYGHLFAMATELRPRFADE